MRRHTTPWALLLPLTLTALLLTPSRSAWGQDGADPGDAAKTEAQAAQKPETESKKEEKGVQEKIDAFFGTWIVGPMWKYFLGYPLFQSTAVEVFAGDKAKAEELKNGLETAAGVSAWTGKRKDKKGKVTAHTVLVLPENRGAAIQFIKDQGAPALADGKPGKVGGMPFIILVLVVGAIFFTARYTLVNVRLFKHSIDCIRGKYDNPDDKGEISHFKALTSALSATVGLGNIAGVALAIYLGGPGAVFWMWIVAFCGMNMKFTSCTLSQLFRRVKDDGSVLGGPMVYLDEGLKAKSPSLAPLGKGLGVLFAVMCILACFGGGNMFQGKMTYAITMKVLEGNKKAEETAQATPQETAAREAEAEKSKAPIKFGFGLVMAALVAIVIIGGIKRIGEVTCRLVPAMCLFYCFVCLLLILANITQVPGLIADIVTQAFSPKAAYGGFLGVLVMGMKRAAFSNEAGLGSAAIAHAAAKTEEPVREGVVAMIGPFIDTIVVCTMTALAILITGVSEGAYEKNWVDASAMTADAFGSLHAVFAYLLIPAVFIFAFSTMISWSYYGERCTEYLVGVKGILPFRIVYCLFVVLGPVLSVSNILDFSDLMILSLAFPNIIGMILLSGKVKGLLDNYSARLRSGEIKPTGNGGAPRR